MPHLRARFCRRLFSRAESRDALNILLLPAHFRDAVSSVSCTRGQHARTAAVRAWPHCVHQLRPRAFCGRMPKRESRTRSLPNPPRPTPRMRLHPQPSTEPAKTLASHERRRETPSHFQTNRRLACRCTSPVRHASERTCHHLSRDGSPLRRVALLNQRSGARSCTPLADSAAAPLACP